MTRPADPDCEALAAKVLSLRAAGLPLRAIGERFGISAAKANRLLARAARQAQRHRDDDAGAAIQAELERLDAAHRVAWQIMADENQPDGRRFRAIDRLLAISARRRRLLGLDAPRRVAVAPAGPPTDEDRVRAIQGLLARALARREADNERQAPGAFPEV